MKWPIPMRMHIAANSVVEPERAHGSHEPRDSASASKVSTESCWRKRRSAVLLLAKAPAVAQVSLNGFSLNRLDSQLPSAEIGPCQLGGGPQSMPASGARREGKRRVHH